MEKSIFRKQSLDKVTSPEQLNDYIKVTRVSIWIVLAIAVILVVSAFVWGFVGSLQTSVTVTGVAENNKIVCYLEDVNEIKTGNTVTGFGKVTSISEKPVSRKYIEEKYDEYTVYKLDPPEWAYEVTVSADGCKDGIYAATIVTDSVKPISFIIGRGE